MTVPLMTLWRIVRDPTTLLASYVLMVEVSEPKQNSTVPPGLHVGLRTPPMACCKLY